jgi:hypothetical protein
MEAEGRTERVAAADAILAHTPIDSDRLERDTAGLEYPG